MATINVPVEVHYSLATGGTWLLQGLNFKNRSQATLIPTASFIVTRDTLNLPTFEVFHTFTTPNDVTLSPTPASLSGDNTFYTATLDLEEDGTYYSQYASRYTLSGFPSNTTNAVTSLVGVRVRYFGGTQTNTGIAFRVDGTIPPGITDRFIQPTPAIGEKLLMRFPGTGEIREYAASVSGGGVVAFVNFTPTEAKAAPKSNFPIEVRFRRPSGLLSPWVPVRFAPFANAVVIDTVAGDDEFKVDTSGSYDLDDGITDRRFYLKDEDESIDVTALAAPETGSPETFVFSWAAIAELTGLDFMPSTPRTFEFEVEDAGGLTDKVEFVVTPPYVSSVTQIGAVLFPSGRMLFATEETGSVKTRTAQLNAAGTGIKLQLVGTVANSTSPSLSLRPDRATVLRSRRTSGGSVVLEESPNGGVTWH